MIQIKPKQATLQDETATQVFARTMPTELHAKSSEIYVELQTKEGKVLLIKKIDLPEEVYLTWGVEDDNIEAYVLSELKVDKL